MSVLTKNISRRRVQLSGPTWQQLSTLLATVGDADIIALAALSSTGFPARTASNTWAQRNIAVGTGLSVANPAGVAGDPTISLGTALANYVADPLSVAELASITAAFGTAAFVNTGTSGAVVPLLNGNLTFGGTVAFGSTVTLNGDPASALQAATKQYVDNLAAGLDVKPSVQIASTANVASLSGEQTIDGVLTSASRILLKDQSTASQNGIYVTASGAWSRATDMDDWSEVPGALVLVEQGTANADSGWVCTANTGGTIGSTSMTWSQFFGTGLFQPRSGDLDAIDALATTAAGRSILEYADPNADQIAFWDDSASAFKTFTSVPPELTISGTTLSLEHTEIIACSDETTALTAGTNKATFCFPFDITVTGVGASVNTAGTALTIDINDNGTTILSTKLTIDSGEKTSLTAATAAVISDTTITAGSEIGVDFDTVTGTWKGCKVWIKYKRTS